MEYKETKVMRLARVQDQGHKCKTRVVPSKKVYQRKKQVSLDD